MESQSVVTVHVKTLGFLTQLSDQSELDVKIEAGSTVLDLIHLVAAQLGADFGQAILDWHGNLHGGVELILNRQHISARRISEIALWENGELIIMPLIGGGQDINTEGGNHVQGRIYEQAAQG